MDELRSFPGAVAEASVVGGKAAALMHMAAAGLPVPPGEVLTTAFFAPWFAQIQRGEAWARVCASEPQDWAQLCPALEPVVAALELDPRQREVLSALERELEQAFDGQLFAVRSSSPQEDLGGASFAGGYATVLGVPREDLEPALRRCFASSPTPGSCTTNTPRASTPSRRASR